MAGDSHFARETHAKEIGTVIRLDILPDEECPRVPAQFQVHLPPRAPLPSSNLSVRSVWQRQVWTVCSFCQGSVRRGKVNSQLSGKPEGKWQSQLLRKMG